MLAYEIVDGAIGRPHGRPGLPLLAPRSPRHDLRNQRVVVAAQEKIGRGLALHQTIVHVRLRVEPEEVSLEPVAHAWRWPVMGQITPHPVQEGLRSEERRV